MPYLQLNVQKELNQEEKHALCEAIGAVMPLLPGKSRENTMMHIVSGQHMELLTDAPCLYLEVRMFKPSPLESKQAFVQAISRLLEEKLDVQPARMYINLVEMDEWGSGGALKG